MVLLGDNLRSRFGDFSPGNHVNVLLLKNLPQSGTGEEIEIPLSPSRAPGIALARRSFHFTIRERKVNHKLGDTGPKALEGIDVEVGPFFRRDAG